MTTPITITLASLLQAPSQTELVVTALGVLGLPGSPFPTAAWQPTDAPYVLVTANAAGMVDVAGLVPQVAAGGLLGLSTGGWLTLLAASNFETTRNAAVATIRILTLVDASGSPSTFAAGELTAVSAQGTTYTNTIAGTLTADGSLPMPFAATIAAASGDAASGPWTLQVAIPGVSIVETIVQIVQHGSDIEGDASLTLRAQQKWSTLGAGANDDAYAYWAQTAPGVVESVTRVAVQGSTPLPGQVTLYLATDTAPVTSVGTITTPPYFVGTGAATLTLSKTSANAPFVNGVLVVQCAVGGAIGTASVLVSSDGGATFEGPITTATSVTLPAEGVVMGFTGGALVAGDTWQSQLFASTTGLVQDYIFPGPGLGGKAPTCVDVFVYPAAAYVLNPAGTIYLANAATHTAVVAALPGLYTGLAKVTPVGGVLYGAVVVQKIMELPGVVNFSPVPADVVLAGNEILSIGSLAGLVVTP